MSTGVNAPRYNADERRAERMFKHWSVAWPLHTVYINT